MAPSSCYLEQWVSMSLLYRISDFICSPTEGQDNSIQPKSNRKLHLFRLGKKYILALQRNLLHLLCQPCSLPSLSPLMPHSLSKQCLSNLFPSLGLEIFLKPEGDLIPSTVFLHRDSWFSMLWKSLKCLVLVKTLLASTNSAFFSVLVIRSFGYFTGWAFPAFLSNLTCFIHLDCVDLEEE